MAYERGEEESSRPRISYSQGVWVESRYKELEQGKKVQPNGSIYYINWQERYVDVKFVNQDGSSKIDSFEFSDFSDFRGKLNSWMIWDL